MFSPKNLILLLALLWASFALKAQSCFIQEDDATGSLAFSTEELAELEAAACSLRAVFPTAFQNDFAVYDFGFYLHQQGYEGGMPQVFQDKIAEVEQESPYFLLFGRELSNNSGLGRFWVEVRLPEGSGYPCLEDAYSSGLIYNQVSASIEIEGVYSSVGASNMLLSGIETLNTLVDKSVNCCNVSEGNRSPLCTFCWFEEDQYGDILDDYGFVEYTGVNLTINTLATPYEGNVNSDYEITIQTSTGHEVNLISETKSFVETTTGQVDVHRYTVDNCELLDDFLRTEATSIGQLGLVYEERIIILEFEGTLRVFYKFSVDSGYSSGPGTLRPGIGNDNRAVIIPVIAHWVLKKAALAGTGVLMHVGITICFEKWFGGYETWGEAWDNTSFTGWELFYAAWSGAFAESMMIDFFGEVGNSMVEYVLNTPSASFSWGGFFSNGVTAGIISGVTNLLTSNLLGDLVTKGKQIFLKYNPNVNFTPNGSNGGGGNSWGKILKELIELAPTFLSKPKTIKAWKFLFDGDVIRKNVEILESVSNALKRGAVNNLPTSNLNELTESTISHILRGNPIGHGNPTGGFHHITALIKRTDVKLIDVNPVGSHGCYKATVKFPNGNRPPKDFFPDSWNESKIISEIENAFGNMVEKPNWGSGQFRGTSTEGVPIRISMRDGKISSAYPYYD